MKIKYWLIFGCFVLLVGFVSASSVNFYYSQNCPHCKTVVPLINYLRSNNIYWLFNSYDVSRGSYNVQGVPLILIITSDKRKIDLIGSSEISNHLKCELKEMTTLDCPTYSVSEGYNLETQSWFIR